MRFSCLKWHHARGWCTQHTCSRATTGEADVERTSCAIKEKKSMLNGHLLFGDTFTALLCLIGFCLYVFPLIKLPQLSSTRLKNRNLTERAAACPQLMFSPWLCCRSTGGVADSQVNRYLPTISSTLQADIRWQRLFYQVQRDAGQMEATRGWTEETWSCENCWVKIRL